MKTSAILICASALCLVTFLGCDQPSDPKAGITLTAPTAGQKFIIGDTVSVKWNEPIATPKLSYTFHEATTGWTPFASASLLPVSDQEVRVILPSSSYSDSFMIKVEDATGAYQATNSGLLSVKYIVITSQLAGQTFHVGQPLTVTWRAAATRAPSLSLMLSTDNGKSYERVPSGSVNAADGTYTWTLGSEESAYPFEYPSDACFIKVREYNNGSYFDVSGKFSIQQ